MTTSIDGSVRIKTINYENLQSEVVESNEILQTLLACKNGQPLDERVYETRVIIALEQAEAMRQSASVNEDKRTKLAGNLRLLDFIGHTQGFSKKNKGIITGIADRTYEDIQENPLVKTGMSYALSA